MSGENIKYKPVYKWPFGFTVRKLNDLFYFSPKMADKKVHYYGKGNTPEEAEQAAAGQWGSKLPLNQPAPKTPKSTATEGLVNCIDYLQRNKIPPTYNNITDYLSRFSKLKQGSVYPILYRLIKNGVITRRYVKKHNPRHVIVCLYNLTKQTKTTIL